MASLSWAGYGPTPPAQDQSGTESRQKKSQTRQLLSCTKCRERKVKCDRTQPCSACCAHGHPKECEFIVGEGNNYSPIQQSYEIKKLRLENQRLKARLQAARLSHSDDEDDEDASTEHKGSRTGSRSSASRQRGFKTSDRIDNLYFGTPGLANIVSDFANLQMGTQSLTHTVPKGKDVYAAGFPTYPFPVIPTHSTSVALLQVLPETEEILNCLDMFQHHAQSCSFPHVPEEMTKKEVQRFLDDAEYNAEKAPDMLALIFVTLATGAQMGQYDRNGGKWDQAASKATRGRSDVFLAASMQSLRNASFMNQPTLLGIQTLVMMGPYLTNSGRFLDAWTLFGTTIRLAHSIGLHRNPKLLDPVPPLPECSVRQTLWWWMLHMDQQYSITLGRPLGISGFGDCSPPQQLTTNPTMLRLSEFINHFTIISRQILSSDGMMGVSKIDEFTDKLLGLWDTMPNALQFNQSWSQPDTTLPDWPLEVVSTMLFAKVQSLLILLNRQRVERTQNAVSTDCPPPVSTSAAGRSRSSYRQCSPSSFGIPGHLHVAPLRGRALVINSSIQILLAFMFFYHRNPAVLICWTMGQQAFNACMILILDAWETENSQNEWLIDEAFAVFRNLETHNVHTLAEVAVQRISEGIVKLNHRRDERAQQMTASRKSSMQQQTQPSLSLDTAAMVDWSGDSVMGNTGMFLLEDPGLQSFVPQSFQPLGWNMADITQSSRDSKVAIPSVSSPHLPVSQLVPAPFPVVASASFMPSPSAIPVTNSPYAVGLQPRMPTTNSNSRRQHQVARHGESPQAVFTPINTNDSSQQTGYPSPRRPQANSARPRGVHRLDRVPRSQQRRK